MKKFRAVSLLVTVLLMTSMSFSLLKVEGTYSVFAKQAGLGFGVSLPLIPLIDTTMYIHMLGNADVLVSGLGTFGGVTFTGATKMAATALEVQAKLPISIMDFNVGATVLIDFLTGDNGTQTVAMPGSIYSGLFVNYQQGLMPLVSYYGQAGMLFKVFDGEKAVNDQIIGAATFDFGNINRSGLYFRAGLSVGL